MKAVPIEENVVIIMVDLQQFRRRVCGVPRETRDCEHDGFARA